MSTIIVPTDFSENARNAVQYAAHLAQQRGDTLLLLHTYLFPTAAMPHGLVYVSSNVNQKEESEDQLRLLAQEIRQTHQHAFDVQTICLEGEFIPELQALAAKREAALVVMGTRGASNFLDRLLGTNTARFIKSAPCPVLAIPANARFSGYSRLAYASGLEEEDASYLKELFEFAPPFGSVVSIVNIKSDQQLDIVPDTQVLTSIRENFPDQEFTVVQLEEEEVVDGLRSYVHQHDIQVLAVSVQDRNFLERLLHQSVTQALVFQAFVPLLALPSAYRRQKPHTQPEKQEPSAIR